MVDFSRRGFLAGLGATIAAPAVVRAELIMPVRRLVVPAPFIHRLPEGLLPCDGRAVPRGLYRGLFAVIGTIYGGDDAAGTFNLPDFSVRTGGAALPTSAIPIETLIRATGGELLPVGSMVNIMKRGRNG